MNVGADVAVGTEVSVDIGIAVDTDVKAVVAAHVSKEKSRYWIVLPMRVGAVVKGADVADGRTVVM